MYTDWYRQLKIFIARDNRQPLTDAFNDIRQMKLDIFENQFSGEVGLSIQAAFVTCSHLSNIFQNHPPDRFFIYGSQKVFVIGAQNNLFRPMLLKANPPPPSYTSPQFPFTTHELKVAAPPGPTYTPPPEPARRS